MFFRLGSTWKKPIGWRCSTKPPLRPNDECTMTYEQASAAWRRFAAMRPDEHPFAHPYYWAAFILSGA